MVQLRGREYSRRHEKTASLTTADKGQKPSSPSSSQKLAQFRLEEALIDLLQPFNQFLDCTDKTLKK
jgi:hypothetical protein